MEDKGYLFYHRRSNTHKGRNLKMWHIITNFPENFAFGVLFDKKGEHD